MSSVLAADATTTSGTENVCVGGGGGGGVLFTHSKTKQQLIATCTSKL